MKRGGYCIHASNYRILDKPRWSAVVGIAAVVVLYAAFPAFGQRGIPQISPNDVGLRQWSALVDKLTSSDRLLPFLHLSLDLRQHRWSSNSIYALITIDKNSYERNLECMSVLGERIESLGKIIDIKIVSDLLIISNIRTKDGPFFVRTRSGINYNAYLIFSGSGSISSDNILPYEQPSSVVRSRMFNQRGEPGYLGGFTWFVSDALYNRASGRLLASYIFIYPLSGPSESVSHLENICVDNVKLYTAILSSFGVYPFHKLIRDSVGNEENSYNARLVAQLLFLLIIHQPADASVEEIKTVIAQRKSRLVQILSETF